MSFWIFIVMAYIVGSFPFGVWIPFLLKKGDPRSIGSFNIGATNVHRLAGVKVALYVFLADFLKGFLVLKAYFYYHSDQSFILLQEQAGWIGLAAVLGHVFSFILKGKGGKGFATTCGLVLFFSGKLFFFLLAIWLLIWKLTRWVSLASLSVVAIACIFCLVSGVPFSLKLASFGIAVVVFYAHRENIVRLMQKKESKT